MTAVQEHSMTTTGPLDYRPRNSRIGAWIGAAVAFFGFTGLSFTLGSATVEGGAVTIADQAAMIGLGVIGAGIALSFLRLRVRADDKGIEVRNVTSTRFFPWQVVTAVNFTDKMTWATVELADDDEMSIMAVQVSDKERALAAIKHLRALLEQSRKS
ncbi:PH domain-containing protein [Glycomyces terrestris]|uniref:PH domain-containing protein n=1 Tax=Glycomyces terrestris TaxID=2493553 RepID=A0A426V4T2_9ACTN|nr:PH domain-containing protein [Glycomyces terrestris]RRS01841.1 PH domain-containing protein [Glycomyces terrestris]